MHILFLTDNFPPEGNAIASRVYERACYWIKWGHQVTIITSAPNFPEGKIYPGYQNKWYQVEYMDGIRVVRIKTFIAANKGFLLRTLDFISYILPAFFASFWQKKVDVVSATSPQLFVGLTAWLIALYKRKPFVLEVADIWPASIVGVGAMRKNILIKALEKLELFLYRRANAIVVLTKAFKKNLCSRNVPANKISVVINGVDLGKYAPRKRDSLLAKQYEIGNETLVIGYLGTHGMAHGLINVLHAAQQLMAHPYPILFLFVGAGAERDSLIAYAKENDIKNVKFIPAQPKDKVMNFWSICDVALVHLKNDPVFAEVIPSKIFEAMGMGLPILLAAPQGEASEIINKEQVGIFVKAYDPKALVNAILSLREIKVRAQYADNSQKCAYLYSRERQAKDMLAVLESQLKHPSPEIEVKMDEFE